MDYTVVGYTPAPWFIDEGGDICGTVSGKSTWVAVGGCEETGIDFKSDADRDLILAAPDMYEALLVVEAALEGANGGFIYRQVSNALKKARGGAEGSDNH